jgi:hypothetical protein
MPLNLTTKQRYIERPFHTLGHEHYEIYPDHPAYEFFFNTSLSANAMTAAICMNKGIDFPEDGYVGLSGRAFDYTVNVMAHASLEMALSLKDPEHIPIIVKWKKKDSGHDNWAPRLKDWMYRSLYPGFVHLYENNQSFIKKHNRDIAALAQLLRDSISHGEKVTSKRFPVSWNGFQINSHEKGKPMEGLINLHQR